MILSDFEILAEMRRGNLVIKPFEEDHVQPASVDLTLNSRFSVAKRHGYVIDPRVNQEDWNDSVDVPLGHAYTLHPGDFVLADTFEEITLGAALAARIEGKSSLGRLGLLTHVTAGFIDPGFKGTLTLELVNLNIHPILLWPGMRIAQLSIMRLSQPASRPYGSPGLRSKYQGQAGPTPSRIHEGFQRWERPVD